MTQRQIIRSIIQFFKSTNFIKGLLLTTAAFIGIAICGYFFDISVGKGVALGVLLVSASDIPGNRKHHLYGMGISLVLVLINYLFINLSLQADYLVVPVMAVLIFCNAIIAVYGFRASLVSFAGLMALVLSFAHPQTGISIIYNLLYISIGAGWYILLASLLRSYQTNKHSLELLSKCMEHTADYLEARASLYKTKDREAIFKKLIDLQREITTDHDDIRNAVMTQRKQSGAQGSKRKQLLLLIDLVDILELAVANPVDFKRYDENNEAYRDVIHTFAEVIMETASALRDFSTLPFNARTKRKNKLHEYLDRSQQAIEHYKKTEGVAQNTDNLLVLRNLYDYVEKQINTLNSIKKVLSPSKNKERQILKKEEQYKFIAHQEYDLSILKEHLSFSSPIFKHSIRLVITILAGYLLGSIFSIQNAYWIILTIVVIMRPGYVLTKDRSKQRILGTLIGGAIAVAIVFITQDTTIYAILIFISMTLAFGLIQQNYRTAAVFITLTLVFIYALLTPDALAVIEFRVLDTLIGAGLASAANFLLWPAWESQTIQAQIKTCIGSIRNYILEVKDLYEDNKEVKTTYKLARKTAFLDMANLHAGFQRMAQEPKSFQSKTSSLYEVVVNCHTLLSATASLGTYIQIHKTTKASVHFQNSLKAIENILLNGDKLLKSHEETEENPTDIFSEAKENLTARYAELTREREKQRATGEDLIKPEFREKLKEARVIIDQLDWMYSVSKNLLEALKNYQKN